MEMTMPHVPTPVEGSSVDGCAGECARSFEVLNQVQDDGVGSWNLIS